MPDQNLVDRAVAVVQQRTAEAAQDSSNDVLSIYIEAYHVSTILTEEGVLTHPDQSSTQPSVKDRVRTSLDAKAKRLLDAAAKEGRLLRFSSHDHQTVPTLGGKRRSFYGSAVYYTTPELHARAVKAVEAADRARDAEREEFRGLVERARAAGLPSSAKIDGQQIIFGGIEAAADLVALLETPVTA